MLAWVKSNMRQKLIFQFTHLSVVCVEKVTSECLIQILVIALCCLMKSKFDRWSMEDVVKRLAFALELLINYNWVFLDDQVNELDFPLQIQLQTNYNWDFFDNYINELESSLQIQLQTNYNWDFFDN